VNSGRVLPSVALERVLSIALPGEPRVLLFLPDAKERRIKVIFSGLLWVSMVSSPIGSVRSLSAAIGRMSFV
jgi:hypothetical protein